MSARKKKIRVANSLHPIADAFVHLKEVPFVEYQENTARDNALKLHSGEVDVAFIPVSEFASHGDYVGLDFGSACSAAFQRLHLHVHGPVTKAHTIYLHPFSCTGGVLLRLLFCRRWQTSPRLVRLPEEMTVEELSPGEGVLLLHEHPVEICSDRSIQMFDLMAEWFDWTGLPFVLNVWATRSGSLSIQNARELSAALYKCCSVFEKQDGDVGFEEDATVSSLLEYSEELSDFSVYLSDQHKQGLQSFLKLAAEEGLLPECSYKTLQFPISGEPVACITKKSADAILADSLAGKRISLIDAVYLAENASLADLGLVADTLRKRLYSRSACNFVLGIEEHELDDREVLFNKVERSLELGVSQLLLYPDPDGVMRSLDEYEQILRQLHAIGNFSVEGFGAQQIISIAQLEGLRIREVAARLVRSGLNIVPSWGGEMLLDELGTDVRWRLPRKQWLRAIRWVHRFGARSSCSLDATETTPWANVASHLNVLRQLQDLTGGFGYFCNYASDDIASRVSVERRLRSTALARIFLDNIPAVNEVRVQASSFLAPASLSFGSNAAYVLVDPDRVEQVDDIAATVRATVDAGLSFNQESLSQLGLVR